MEMLAGCATRRHLRATFAIACYEARAVLDDGAINALITYFARRKFLMTHISRQNL